MNNEQLLTNFYNSYQEVEKENSSSSFHQSPYSSYLKMFYSFLDHTTTTKQKNKLRPTGASVRKHLSDFMSKTKKTSVDKYVSDFIGAAAEVVDALTELKTVSGQAVEELGPMVFSEVNNFLFPKKRILVPGTLCYFQPQKAKLYATRSTIQSQLNKSGVYLKPKFLYRYSKNLTCSSCYSQKNTNLTNFDEVIRDMYVPIDHDVVCPPGTVVMFLGYCPASSPSALKKDYLHSKCEILSGEQRLVLGFPKLPWSRHMIPDDILIPL